MIENLKFEPMICGDTNSVVQIIAKSMNENEGRWANKTINFHYFCQNSGVSDGRIYYVAKINEQIVGISGLHSYEWGPEDLSWLGWFAVDPDFQGKKIGYFLMQNTIELAKQKGFRKLLIETYSDKDFEKARNFYERYGFHQIGKIEGYIAKQIDMVVFGLELNQS